MPYKMSDTLCWNCQNAVPNKDGRGCTWSKRFEPVAGWTATSRNISSLAHGNRPYLSYRVTDCPEFVADPSYKEVMEMTKEELEKKLEKTEQQLQDCIDELCFKCGAYRGDASKLQCDRCKWEAMKW